MRQGMSSWSRDCRQRCMMSGDSSAVGVEQAAEEQFGVLGNEFLLPVLQLDRAEMLPAGRVLREQARPVLPVRDDRRTANRLHAVHGAVRVYGAHDVLRLVDQPRIDVVAGDPQRVHAPPVERQATDPEIQAPAAARTTTRRASPSRTTGTRSPARPEQADPATPAAQPGQPASLASNQESRRMPGLSERHGPDAWIRRTCR